MTTINFEECERQAQLSSERFEYASSYLDLSTLRMRCIRDFIVKIRDEHMKHAKNMPTIELKYFPKVFQGNEIVAPGIPGCHTARLEILGSLSRQIKIESESFASFIDKAILEQFLDFTFDSEVKLKAIVNGYLDYKKYRSSCESAVKSSLKEANSITMDAEKANKEYLAAQKAMKSDKIEKANKNLKDVCKEYERIIALLRINVRKFNTAHANFLRYTENTIRMMNEFHPRRIKIIASMINDALVPSMTTFSNNYRDVQNWFEHSAVEWEPHFIAFINSKGIVRTIIKPKDFVNHENICYTAPILQMDAPIFVANVVKSFISEDPLKMSVTEGQRIGIFENLYHNWVLAEDIDGSKKYVPSSCLSIEKRKICLVRVGQLGWGKDVLSIKTGDLLIINEESEQEYTCTNLKGEVGKVPKYAVIAENQ